jgi:hypothetical protein
MTQAGMHTGKQIRHPSWLQHAVTALLVTWMAVFAPATCVYHGFLLGAKAMAPVERPAMTHAQHAGHNKQHTPALATTDEDPFATPSAKTMTHHKPLSGDTTVMQLLAIAVQGGALLQPPAESSSLYRATLVLNSHVSAPPDQPPRLA